MSSIRPGSPPLLPPALTVTYGNEDLDVYSAGPDSASKPLIVYVHGGAWRSESKEAHRRFALRLRELAACPVAVLDYRLTNGNELKHPAHARDVLDALHFLITWPDGPPFDHTRLFLVAHSAGAHILTSIFLDAARVAPYLPASVLQPERALLRAVRGIALASGIYDVAGLAASFPEYEHGFLRAVFREPFDFWNTMRYPLHAGAEAAHWLVVHSVGDEAVDEPQSEGMYAHLRALYEERRWGAELVEKDFGTITGGHYYTNEEAFAQLIAGWVTRLAEPTGRDGT